MGGRDSPACVDSWRVPSLFDEAEARGQLGGCLVDLGVERERGFDLMRSAVALLRRAVQAAGPGDAALHPKATLAKWQHNLGAYLVNTPGSDGMAQAEACLRQALELSSATNQIAMKQRYLIRLINMGGIPGSRVTPAEAASFLSRLNAIYAQTGRNPERVARYASSC